ncbi:putative ferric-chelate reductase 1 homolog [Mya arenaria]|uniref:putative ferric-chelate reductase 1 homolog n=1 Tax=Mya arenaria TaxID=6604 RepID=UPI0022E8C1A6|nr:putative ferric-chelate reductase 1 homolog [Mya arenaria]
MLRVACYYIIVFITSAEFVRSKIVWDNFCGINFGCFHDCTDNGCGFLISWVDRPWKQGFDFTMSLATDDIYTQQWFAIGLSDDDRMGNDCVIECIKNEEMRQFASVQHSYNEQYYNIDIPNPQTGLRAMSGSYEDGVLKCEFTRQMDMEGDKKIFSLDTPRYMFVAHGNMHHGSKVRHSLFPGPFISPKPVDLTQLDDIQGNHNDYFVKIHGSLMILAWVLLASLSLVLARYYKQQWPMGKVCDRRVWYQAHKVLILVTFSLVLSGFVIIWVKTRGLSKMRGATTVQHAHPFLGVVIMGLTFINPLMAFLRPNTGTLNRPVFKYIHGFIGTIVYVLAVLNVLLGMSLPESKSPASAFWVLVGFAVYQVVLEIFLGLHECYLIKTGRLSDYEMKELSAIRRDSITSINKPPPGSLVKNIVLIVHATVLVGFTVASVTLLCTA